jgi:hypothetical protein
MMQKVGAQYALKKIGDYVMAPPPKAVEEELEEQHPQSAQDSPGDLDGQIITDENGERLGVARRIANVSVYVIAESRSGLEDQLKESVTDEEGRVFFHHNEAGKLTGLIYVPDPGKRPPPVSASRPDDI